ncbi:UNVERIFIED_CONTAM: hypothetical protein Sradi_1491100 [Sesamum radiatum]|uniref:Uncharacterized protein n=1 Tax=Sesamum radiatum TaxID=300843 RepID=A0AAW2U7Q9_SESRA
MARRYVQHKTIPSHNVIITFPKTRGTLSPAIANLTFLRVVNLRGNVFRGPIPAEIGRLFHLQSLLLMENSLGGVFPTNISQCTLIFASDFWGFWGNFRECESLKILILGE